MAERDLNKATTTDFTNTVPDYVVSSKALDAANDSGETYWYFSDSCKNYGYYCEIPEINSAANSLATWAFGRGWDVGDDLDLKLRMENFVGMGKDTFDSIMFNHEVTCLVVGDSFCEIKRSLVTRKIINLVPISPERVRVVFKEDGMIKRYDVWNGSKWRPVKIKNMFHSHNKRIGDQVHGTSQIDASRWVIDARNEALIDNRKIMHRMTVLGIAYYKTNNEQKISKANTEIQNATKNVEMVGLPEETAEIKDFPSKPTGDRQQWISYLENFFYQIFGVPRSIATSDGTSEVGGKMGHVIFEPVYTREQKLRESEFWNQLGIRIKWNRPPSLAGLQQETEEKNSGQLRIQPNDVEASMTRE